MCVEVGEMNLSCFETCIKKETSRCNEGTDSERPDLQPAKEPANNEELSRATRNAPEG